MWGDDEDFKIFLSNCLIPSRFNQELRRKGGIHRLFKGNFPPILEPFDLVGERFDGHDRTVIVAHH